MPLVNIGQVHIDFPHTPYQCQELYMEKVVESLEKGKNALLESPTGTGKTLCLLCSSLAWQQRMKESPALQIGYDTGPTGTAPSSSSNNNFLKAAASSAPLVGSKKAPTIIYASRTHSQLVQVIRELKATVYRPRMSMLGSREQLCIHPEVSRLTGAHQNRRCGAITTDRACRFKNNLSERGSSACGAVMDIEELQDHGKSHMVCPYYLVRDQIEMAELILMPYNYLIDPETRESVRISWENAVVIIDEAHNIESAAAEAASFDLTSAITSGCIQDLQKLLKEIKANKGAFAPQPTASSPALLAPPNETDLCNLITMLANLEAAIDSEPLPQSGWVARPGSFIFDLLERAGVTMSAKESYLLMLQKALNAMLDQGGSREISRAAGARLEILTKAFRCVFRGNNAQECWELSKFYRVAIQGPKQQQSSRDQEKGRTLSFWCFSPSILMRSLEALNVRSVILTSGTLTPMASFAHELGVPFPITLENKHVISSDQLWVGVVSNGPTGEQLSSSFERRNDAKYLSDLGETVARFCAVIPAGVLVFFPSYGVMDQCLNVWRRKADLWARISAHKAALTEPKESAALKICLAEYDSLIKDRGAALLFAVCRGKVSEGMDFADNRARAVLITGIPFPPAKDPKVEQKRDYLDKVHLPAGVTRLRGMDWYVQQASRAVNQAVGRVIRHRFDYGAVILLDERFANENQRQGLSSWIRPWVKVYNNFKEAESEVQSFFVDIAKDPRLRKGGKPRMKAGARGSGARDQSSMDRAAVVVAGVEEDASYIEPDAIKQMVAPNGILEDETSMARFKQWKATINNHDLGIGKGRDGSSKGAASSSSSSLSSLLSRGGRGEESKGPKPVDPVRAALGPKPTGKSLSQRLGLGLGGKDSTKPATRVLGLSKTLGPQQSLTSAITGLSGSSATHSFKRSSSLPMQVKDEVPGMMQSTPGSLGKEQLGGALKQQPAEDDVDADEARRFVMQIKSSLNKEQYKLFTSKVSELRQGTLHGHKEFVSWARSIVSLVVDARAPLSLLHNLNLLYVKSQALRNTFQQVMTRDVPPDYQPRDTTDHHQLPDPTPSQEVVKKENVRPLVSHPKGWVPNKRSRLLLGLKYEGASTSSSQGRPPPRPPVAGDVSKSARAETPLDQCTQEEDESAMLSQRTRRDRETYRALQSVTEVQVPTYVEGKSVGECAICCNKAVMYMSNCNHLACLGCWQKQVRAKGQCFNRCSGTIRLSDLRKVIRTDN